MDFKKIIKKTNLINKNFLKITNKIIKNKKKYFTINLMKHFLRIHGKN